MELLKYKLSEIKNVLETKAKFQKVMLLFDNNVISSKDFANEVVVDSVHLADKTLKTALDNFKYAYVKKILQECSWNQTKAD